MRFPPDDLPAAALDFLEDRHLATLSLVVSADEVHVSPVGFTWDNRKRIARVITFASAKKVRLLDAASTLPAALTQVDGAYWLALHGRARVSADPNTNADALRRYGRRYSRPRDLGSDRRTIEIAIDRVLGRVPNSD